MISALGSIVSRHFAVSTMWRHESDIVYLAPVPEHDELSVLEASGSLRLSLICFPSYLPTSDRFHLSGTAWFAGALLVFFTTVAGD